MLDGSLLAINKFRIIIITSVDGIDAVLIKISGYGINTKLKIIDFITVKIPKPIKNEVFKNSYSYLSLFSAKSAVVCG